MDKDNQVLNSQKPSKDCCVDTKGLLTISNKIIDKNRIAYEVLSK